MKDYFYVGAVYAFMSDGSLKIVRFEDKYSWLIYQQDAFFCMSIPSESVDKSSYCEVSK